MADFINKPEDLKDAFSDAGGAIAFNLYRRIWSEYVGKASLTDARVRAIKSKYPNLNPVDFFTAYTNGNIEPRCVEYIEYLYKANNMGPVPAPKLKQSAPNPKQSTAKTRRGPIHKIDLTAPLSPNDQPKSYFKGVNSLSFKIPQGGKPEPILKTSAGRDIAELIRKGASRAEIRSFEKSLAAKSLSGRRWWQEDVPTLKEMLEERDRQSGTLETGYDELGRGASFEEVIMRGGVKGRVPAGMSGAVKRAETKFFKDAANNAKEAEKSAKLEKREADKSRKKAEKSNEEEKQRRREELANQYDPIQRALGGAGKNLDKYAKYIVGDSPDAIEHFKNKLEEATESPSWLSFRHLMGSIAGGNTAFSSGAMGLTAAQVSRLLGGPRALGQFAGGVGGGFVGAGIGKMFGNAALGRTLGAAAGGLVGGPIVAGVAGSAIGSVTHARENNITRMDSMGPFSPQVIHAQVQRDLMELRLQQKRAGILGSGAAQLETSFQNFDKSRANAGIELDRFWQNTLQPVVEFFLLVGRKLLDFFTWIMDKVNDLTEAGWFLMDKLFESIAEIIDAVVPGKSSLASAMKKWFDAHNQMDDGKGNFPDLAGLFLGDQADRVLNPIPAPNFANLPAPGLPAAAQGWFFAPPAMEELADMLGLNGGAIARGIEI